MGMMVDLPIAEGWDQLRASCSVRTSVRTHSKEELTFRWENWSPPVLGHGAPQDLSGVGASSYLWNRLEKQT